MVHSELSVAVQQCVDGVGDVSEGIGGLGLGEFRVEIA
jgi:hypothetical protein